jgi:hypothetical protein
MADERIALAARRAELEGELAALNAQMQRDVAAIIAAPTHPKDAPSGGLPKRCECGGKLLYVRDFGRVFSVCDTCTPVVAVKPPEARKP